VRNHEGYAQGILNSQRALAAMRPDHSLFGGRPSPRRVFVTIANSQPSATYPLLPGTNWGYTLELTAILLGEVWRPHFDCFYVAEDKIDPISFDFEVPETDHLDRSMLALGSNSKDVRCTYIRLDKAEIRTELFACADKRPLEFQNVLWNEYQLVIAQALLKMIEDRTLHPRVVNEKIIPALRDLPHRFEAVLTGSLTQAQHQNQRDASPRP
jgi:hypothetical protein